MTTDDLIGTVQWLRTMLAPLGHLELPKVRAAMVQMEEELFSRGVIVSDAIDELHAQKDRELLEALTRGIVARRQPLILFWLRTLT